MEYLAIHSYTWYMGFKINNEGFDPEAIQGRHVLKFWVAPLQGLGSLDKRVLQLHSAPCQKVAITETRSFHPCQEDKGAGLPCQKGAAATSAPCQKGPVTLSTLAKRDGRD